MNAAAGNGEDNEGLRAVITDLQAQRTHLYTEVARLKQERNDALAMTAAVQQEIAQLRARINELEGGPA